MTGRQILSSLDMALSQGKEATSKPRATSATVDEQEWRHPQGRWSVGMKVKMLVTQSQSCPALCNPMDRSPGHGILQASTLDWVAISCSSASCWPRDGTHCRQILYHLSHQGSPFDRNLTSNESLLQVSAQTWPSLSILFNWKVFLLCVIPQLYLRI